MNQILVIKSEYLGLNKLITKSLYNNNNNKISSLFNRHKNK